MVLVGALFTFLLVGANGCLSRSGERHRYNLYRNNNNNIFLEGYVNGPNDFDVRIGFETRFKRDVNFDVLENGHPILKLQTLPCNFTEYDTNGDGSLSVEEFELQLNQRHFYDRQTVFNIMDGNGDVSVTEEEFMKVARAVANEILFPECIQRIHLIGFQKNIKKIKSFCFEQI